MAEPIESHYLEDGDSRTHYYAAGEGEPVVLLHGGGSDSRQWLETMQALSGRYRVYAPDLPGFGGSVHLADSYNPHRLTPFVERFLNGLGLREVKLMGHSLGGYVALSFALHFPERVDRLVLVDSLGLGNEIAWWIRLLSLPALALPLGAMALGVWHGLRWVLKHRPHLSLHLPFWLDNIFPPHPAQKGLGWEVATIRGQKTDLSHRLPEVSVPTLIVWGDRDEVLPVRQAHRAHRLIPRSRLHVLEKGGHSAYRDHAPQFHRILLDFLS